MDILIFIGKAAAALALLYVGAWALITLSFLASQIDKE